jgi:hypothetical protein
VVDETEDNATEAQITSFPGKSCPYFQHEITVPGVEQDGTAWWRALEDFCHDVSDGEHGVISKVTHRYVVVFTHNREYVGPICADTNEVDEIVNPKSGIAVWFPHEQVRKT